MLIHLFLLFPAAMDVTDIVHGRIESDEDKQFFIPFDKCKEGDNIYNCIQTLLGGKEVNHKGQGLWVCLKRLDGDLKQVREDYPHMLPSSTATARKMGFPEVIMPGQSWEQCLSQDFETGCLK